MRQQQTSFPPETQGWWREVSRLARAVFLGAIAVAFGLVIWEAADGSLGPERPLGVVRLGMRVGCFVACGACFVIAGVGMFRGWRWRERLRKGLCLRCGYDVRATSERCPECGAAREGGAGGRVVE